ncbi:hypothetical protein C2G38_2064601, partial [Gigaspora rosea]
MTQLTHVHKNHHIFKLYDGTLVDYLNINALLQFSYIESNQLKAHYREINIAKFTQELASEFKSMAKTL